MVAALLVASCGDASSATDDQSDNVVDELERLVDAVDLPQPDRWTAERTQGPCLPLEDRFATEVRGEIPAAGIDVGQVVDDAAAYWRSLGEDAANVESSKDPLVSTAEAVVSGITYRIWAFADVGAIEVFATTQCLKE